MEQRSELAPRLAAVVREVACELEAAVHEDCDLIEQIEHLLVEVRLPVRRELTDEEQQPERGSNPVDANPNDEGPGP